MAQGEHGYVVPTYEAPPAPCWYHFLHGNVPGHQIDFIYRPAVSDGPLTRQHFSHLARLVRYIEPWPRSDCAFAIGNLSRDDTQHEPGHGAVALILGLRIHGAKDHAGRQDPPFCHAIVAVDGHLDEARLREASAAFHRRLLPGEESEAEGSGWYHTYVRHAENAAARLPLLRAYVADFDDLPAPGASSLGLRWIAGDAAPRRIVVTHVEGEPFEVIAACASRIAQVLMESDIRWTVISSGREADVPGGVSVRFVPEQDAGGEEDGVRVLRREEVPVEAEAIAAQLFGARAAEGSPRLGPRTGWRQLPGAGVARSAPPARAGKEDVRVPARPEPESAQDGPRAPSRRLLAWIALPMAVGGAIVAALLGTAGSTGEVAPSPSPEATDSGRDGGDAPPLVAEIKSAPAPSAPPAAPSAKAQKRGPGLRQRPAHDRKRKSAIFDVP